MSDVFTVGKKTVYPIVFEIDYGQMKSINCYLLHDGETLTLIDAGLPLEKFYTFFNEKLTEYGFTIESIDQIILTHHHEDHTALVNRIVKQHTIPVYAHHLAIERLHFEQSYLHKKQEFFTRLYEEYGCSQQATKRLEKMAETLLDSEKIKLTVDVLPLFDGDMISGMTVMEVPGHSPDSILLYDAETGWQFVGDLVIKTGAINALIDFNEDLQLLPTVVQQQQSLLKSRELQTRMIFAGHQLPFSNHLEVIDKNLQRIQRKCTRVVDAIKEGNHTALQLAIAIYGSKAEKEFHLVMSEIIGYLYYAEIQGLIKKVKEKGHWNFYIK